MRYILILAALSLLLLCACAASSSGADTKKDYGYLVLSGSMVNREAYIDGVKAGVDPEDDSHYFKLKTGLHKLEIRNAKRILMMDDVQIDCGQNTGITVP